MPRVCSICGFSCQRGRSEVLLHELPAETVRRKQWVDAVYKLTGEHRMLQWQTVNYTICSRHFNKSDYKQNLKFRLLEKNVIPTILGPPLEPRTRTPAPRKRANGRLSDKDLELALVQAASSASTSENEKTAFQKRKDGEETATPREDVAATSDQKVVIPANAGGRTSAPRKRQAGKKTSVPRKRKADETTVVSGDAVAVTDKQVGLNSGAVREVEILKAKEKFGSPVAANGDAETSEEDDEEEASSPGLTPIGCERRFDAPTIQERLAAMRQKNKNLRRKLGRRNARVHQLRQRLADALRARRASETPWRAENKAFAALLREAHQGDLRAQFLLEQVCNFGKQKTRWSEPFIRECVLLCSVSAPTYDLVRTSPLLKGAPSRTTLKRFIGCSVKEEGEEQEVDQDGDEERVIVKTEDELRNTNELEEELSNFSGSEDALDDTIDQE